MGKLLSAIILSIVLIVSISCKSADVPKIEIPRLDVSLERPELMEIPAINQDNSNIVDVLQAYNLNFIKLISFIDLQDFILKEQEHYYLLIIDKLK